MDGVHALFPPDERELPAQVRQYDTRQKHLSVMLLALVANNLHLYIHSRRVQLLTHHLAQILHLPPDEATQIELAALVHDIGKLAIPAEVLQKASRLTHEEFAHIKQHPAYGAVILRQMGMLNHITGIVYHHHEHWNGSGYPAGLQEEAIPLGARIVAIADAFEVITSHRSYQTPRTPAQGLEELRRCAGSQFDPALVDRFCTSLVADLSRSWVFSALSQTSYRIVSHQHCILI